MRRTVSISYLLLLALGLSACTLPLDGGGDGDEDPEVLLGPVWTLQTLRTDDGHVRSLRDDERYTIQFRADGKLGGQADCNQYGADYRAEAGRLALGSISSTLAFCREGSSAHYLEALRHEELRFARDGDVLRLTYGRSGLLVYRR